MKKQYLGELIIIWEYSAVLAEVCSPGVPSSCGLH